MAADPQPAPPTARPGSTVSSDLGSGAIPLSPGSVPPPPGDELVVLLDRAIDARVVVAHEPQSGVSEQYRSFRANLVALNPGGQPRALAVTSAIKGEGKSVTVANLAAALAELPDTRVLIVDADLRSPAQHQLFGRPREPGLAEAMLDFVPIERVIAPTSLPSLHVLSAGRAVRNSSELLGSSRMSDLIGALKAEFQWILFDTPPALPFADAATLGTRVDGLLYVVRLEKTPRDQSARALELLRNAGCNVLGSFLAGTRSNDGDVRSYVVPED
jgi:capsular exopolysaccharide synthesis family protein